jgi:hypothetical protein
MSTYNFATLMDSWEQLFAAVEAHEAELPVVAPYKAPLRESLDRIRGAKNHQEMLSASRQQATRETGQLVQEGRELVARLRSQIKAELGRRDERLRLFGIKPIPPHRGTRPKGGAEGTGSPEGYGQS